MAEDNGVVSSVVVIVVGENLIFNGSKQASDQWTITIPYKILSRESITLKMVAKDASQNEWTSDAFVLGLVDTLPPVVNLILDPNPPTTGDLLRFGGQASDISGVVSLRIEYAFGDGEISSERLLLEEDGTFGLSVTIPSAPSGDLKARVIAEDSEGNVMTGEWVIWPVLDNDAPVLGTLDDIRLRVGETIKISDPEGTDNIGIVNWSWSWVQEGETRYAFGRTISLKFVQPGKYEVTLKVGDEAGNTDETNFMVKVSDVHEPISAGLIIGIVIIVLAVGITLGFLKFKTKNRNEFH